MIPSSLAACGATCHASIAASLSPVLKCCFTADLLRGSDFLNSGGTSPFPMTTPSVAALAAASASSFPLIPTCPGDHLIFNFTPLFLFLSASTCTWKASKMYLTEPCFRSAAALIAAWLSTCIVMAFATLLLTEYVPSAMAAHSASYTV